CKPTRPNQRPTDVGPEPPARQSRALGGHSRSRAVRLREQDRQRADAGEEPRHLSGYGDAHVLGSRPADGWAHQTDRASSHGRAGRDGRTHHDPVVAALGFVAVDAPLPPGGSPHRVLRADRTLTLALRSGGNMGPGQGKPWDGGDTKRAEPPPERTGIDATAARPPG